MTSPMDSTVRSSLTVKGLSKSFGSHLLWSNLDLSFQPGDRVALTGVSGSGKSTLLNCLGLLERPTSGSICWGDRDLVKLRPGLVRRFRRDHLGYLFQDYALIEDGTVAENLQVALGAWGSRGHARGRRREAFAQVLDQVGLSGREKDRIHILSGGEQQRVAMARLLLRRPSIVLADEPTAALDGENEDRVLHFLDEIASSGAIVIIATHSVSIRDRCDQIVHLFGEGSVEVTTPVAKAASHSRIE
ncbi:putative ABC transport system ATP-binding protein [Austwickia chelonae]|uniref:ABC transporter ATP-binding protein n=1 Tax=Austwickia chelonae TaxID=100225 RepID=UPI0008AC9E32|nr:ATP-binding cassette domain-containing protein [Austwickia chelonae]SEW03301.1 putative ABC transport system ATP-binding protein [Austwickia chelonae]